MLNFMVIWLKRRFWAGVLNREDLEGGMEEKVLAFI